MPAMAQMRHHLGTACMQHSLCLRAGKAGRQLAVAQLAGAAEPLAVEASRLNIPPPRC